MFRGELKDPRKIRLLNQRGEGLPVQAKATARWPEGTIKFLCLDFLTDLEPNQAKSFALEYGTEVESGAESHLQVKKDGQSLSFDTGILQVSFAPGRQFCSEIKVNGRRVTEGAVTGRAEISKGEPLSVPQSYPLLVERVELVEQGLVQATVYLKGSYGNEVSATELSREKKRNIPRYPVHAFVRLYADSGRIHVIHSFGYNGDENQDFVRRYGLVVPTVSKNPKLVFGGDRGAANEVEVNGKVRLAQLNHNTWKMSGPRQSAGKRFGGWAALKGNQNSVVAGLRHAWQQWPVSFSTDPSGALTLDIYGGDEEAFLDLRYKGPDFDRKTGEGFHRSKSMFTGEAYSRSYGEARHRAMGLLKISELFLDFTPGADPPAVGNGFHQLLAPWPGAKRFAETRVFGLTGYYHDKDPRHPRAQTYFNILLDFPLAAHEVNGLYGWVDYPDAPDFGQPKNGKFDTSIFKGGVGWTNGERQLMGYFGHYAASGWQRALDTGHQTALHTIGIDIEHYGGDQTQGGPHRHNQVHWGDAGGPRQAGWRGWYMHYWLTGHNEVWRTIQELHPVPTAAHKNSNIMRWPYHPSWYPEIWPLQRDWKWTWVHSSDGTPFHFMNLMRWETNGDRAFVRFTEKLMEFWSSNPFIEKEDKKMGPTMFKVDLEKDSIIYSDSTRFAPADPENPPHPYCHTYYFNTYGAVTLASQWAQLTGSKHAVDLILLIGDYHAAEARGNQRVDIRNSDRRQGAHPWQLYNALEGMAPAYWLLRRASHPKRAERWKKAMEWRLFNYVYGSPGRMAKDAMPLGSESYTAENWKATNVRCDGKNGPKIFAATAMTGVYTLWFSHAKNPKAETGKK
jgi:hypothetical protein